MLSADDGVTAQANTLVTRAGPAPARHTSGLAVRAVVRQLRRLAPLGFGQTRPAHQAELWAFLPQDEPVSR
ncbi:MAG: hypothetical protein ACREDJ_09255, partial [Methylocella sp.]